ncbi:MAG TPA: DNA polymerase I [Holosporales bacterium]|nr:DNA polymerase I [Holosporales bacterium]
MEKSQETNQKISEKPSKDTAESAKPKIASEAAAQITSKTSGKHIYLIDGSGFIFRAYHALPPLVRGDGTPVGAVLGFCNIILKLLDANNIDNMAVVFDSARANYRHDIYPDYKANRSETPEDLIPQFPLFREACEAFNLPQIELIGYEADDIIATYAKQAVAQGNDVTIVSSDKDLMQLVNDNVRMMDPMKNTFIGYDEVMAKFGVHPDKVIDIQSLAGDASDNIPGVPGIGVKTAALLINEFGDLDTLLEQAHTIKQPKRRESLINHVDDARMSRKLVTLATDAPLELNLQDFALHQPDPEKLHKFLFAQGFNTLIGRLLKRGLIQPFKGEEMPSKTEASLISILQKAPQDYILIQDLETLKKWIFEARDAGVVAFDTETTALNPTKAELVGFSLSYEIGKACYVPVGHQVDGEKIDEGQVDLQEALSLLRDLLQNPAVKVVGQNLKYDMRILLNYGIEVASYEDTMVMSYCCDGATHGHGLDELAMTYFDHEMLKFKDLMEELKKASGRKDVNFSDVELGKATAYAAEDADYTFRLFHLLRQRLLEKKAHDVYHTIDLPMVKILALMEHKGVLVDPQILSNMSASFAQHIERLSGEIHALAGRDFNIGSPKQLGEILFDELGLTGGKKSKSGTFSTSVDILDKLAEEGHEIAEKVLEWRHYSKLKSTYSDALPNEISRTSGRVHTTYGLTITSTGRLSSSDPNLQNIPIRTEEGRQIRQAFVAQKGYKLVSLDYSQIELRLLAHMADMDSLKKAFKERRDIHTATASDIFSIPLDEVTPEVRRSAKAINFGIIYGISAFGLARQLNISRQEAAQHIETYYERYPGIRRYMEKQKNVAREQGHIETILGRHCYIKGLHDTNPMRRAFAERQATNAPLQGSSADIIKRAMNGIAALLAPYNEAEKESAIEQIFPQHRVDVEKEEPSKTIPQLDLFGLPEGVSLGMPKEEKKHPQEPQIITLTQSTCPIVGPYGCNGKVLTGGAARLLLQVHDELIFEIKEELVKELAPKIQRLMEKIIHLNVPLVVDVGIGDNWDEAH